MMQKRDLPTSSGRSHPLHVSAKKGDVHGNLKKKSPWFQSIQDPLHGADCKIPDEVGDETGTLQNVARAVCTVGAGGSAGFRINTPYSCFGGVTGQGWTKNTAASAPNPLLWGPDIAWESSSVLMDYAQGHRVVSCAVYVQPACSLADCSGEMCFFQSPMDRQGYSSYDSYADLYGSVLVALNSTKPTCVRWYPYSRSEQTFGTFYNPKAPTVGDGTFGSVPFWELGFVTTGVPAGVSFRVTAVVNYEFLPRENAVNILDAAPSPNDAMETDLVENWVATTPSVFPVNERKISTPPSAVTPNQAESAGPDGFGMFTDVLTELLPYALEGVAMLL
jgi:hypothetical protein